MKRPSPRNKSMLAEAPEHGNVADVSILLLGLPPPVEVREPPSMSRIFPRP